MRTRSVPASLMTHAAICAVSLAMLYPLLWMLAGSFRPNQGIFNQFSIWPESFDIGAYARGWAGLQVTFGRFFVNSLIVSLAAVVGNVLSCSLAAFAFARLEFRGRRVLFALMLGTLMMPYHVTLIPQYLLFLSLDWVDTFLPLVVPRYMAVDAFFIFLMVQFFRGIPKEIDQAAMIDGCSPWAIYWRIILPLSTPVLATAAIFSFIWTWDDFFGPLIYINDMGRYTVQLGLRTFVDSGGQSDWSALFAMSVLALLPVFACFLFFQRLLIEGVATTGMRR